jgi:hypothetical protein
MESKNSMTFCGRCQAGIAVDPFNLTKHKWKKRFYRRKERWLCPSCARKVTTGMSKNSIRLS